MNPVLKYFRIHKWQRRVLTSLIVIIIGLAAGVILLPIIRDYRLIHQLGSNDASVRHPAELEAVIRAKKRPAFLDRLESALDTEDDTLFYSAASVLDRLGKFKTSGRRELWIDRYLALSLEQSNTIPGPDSISTQKILLRQVILSRRSNKYTRRALAAAINGGEPVRAMSSVLAAMLGDDEALGELLADDSPQVVSSAALNVGIAEIRIHAERIRELIDTHESMDVKTSCCYALWRLTGGKAVERIIPLLKEARLRNDRPACQRLLSLLAKMEGMQQATDAVMDLIRQQAEEDGHPSPMAIHAAGRLKIADAAPFMKKVLASATKPESELTQSQIVAAINAADTLKIPVRRELYHICKQLWHPELEWTMMYAARALGRQARLQQPGVEGAPSPEQCIETLRWAVRYAALAQTRPATTPADSDRAEILTTPVASAAAAVAAWEAGAADRVELIKYATAADVTLPGTYISWNIGVDSDPAAFDLGLKMLPPLDAPVETRVWNDHVRAAGSLLLASSAKNPQQRKQAVERITSRLEGGRYFGGEDNPIVAGTYKSALLILDRRQYLPAVRKLLYEGGFPERTAITALCVAGDKDVLRWMLWNGNIPLPQAAQLIIGKSLNEVLAATAPDLPQVEPVGGEDLRRWQVRIMRNYFALHYDKISLGM